MIDLDELERKAKAATPGPWFTEYTASFEDCIVTADSRKDMVQICAIDSAYDCPLDDLNAFEAEQKANADFITAFNPSVAQELIRRLREAEKDAERYRWLRERDLETIDNGGIFAGSTPDNFVLNGEDLDEAIDAAMEQGNG